MGITTGIVSGVDSVLSMLLVDSGSAHKSLRNVASITHQTTSNSFRAALDAVNGTDAAAALKQWGGTSRGGCLLCYVVLVLDRETEWTNQQQQASSSISQWSDVWMCTACYYVVAKDRHVCTSCALYASDAAWAAHRLPM